MSLLTELNDAVASMRVTSSAQSGVQSLIVNRYYGAYAADPLTRPDGTPRQVSDRYFNTTSGAEKTFNGTIWYIPNIDSAALATQGGSALVGHIAAGNGAQSRTVMAKLREIVSIADYPGGVGDGSTDSYPAYLLAQAAVGTGTIRFTGQAGTVYFFASYPNAADVLNGPLLDVDPGVIIRIPQAQGLDATYGNGSIRVTRTTRFHQSIKDVTFYVSPQTSSYVGEKLQWPIAANADRTTVKAVDCTVGVSPLKLNWDGGGDAFVTDTFVASAAASYSCGTAMDGYIHLGIAPLLPGDVLSASFSAFNNTNTTLFVVVQCDGGYYGVYGNNATGYLTQFYKLTGIARPAPVTLTPESLQHASYFPLASVMSIKVRDLRHFSICLNGVSAVDVETASNIVSAGFGNYTTTGAGLTVQDVMKIQNTPIVQGVTGLTLAVFGDSITAGSGVQHIYGSWPEQLKCIFDGACGVRIKNVLNYAVSGATSSTQLPLCTAGNIAGAQYVMFLVGTNDIQGAGSVATYLANMGAMIDTCVTAGARVIVGIPPMFYSMAAASGRGNNTTNFGIGSPYRSGIMRLCATKGVKMVDTMGGLGNILATYLDTTFALDSMVYDNVHPTMFGRLLLAQLFGNALLGDLASVNLIAENGTLLPTASLAAGALFTTDPATFNVDTKTGEISVFGVVDLPASVADGTTIYTLPTKLRPRATLRFACLNSTFGTSYLVIAPTGVVQVYKSPAAGGYVSMQMAYNKQ
ncbi:SGNH/GDSL hydrolase family protein [Glaciimonas immobilis]|uniref:Lysophospholipase L1-like esterase n=1 Tax=Glaciimonas immobilis TaxID=728004 RepID=A0A840RV46_9BURK|nr:SGNH/GDSL hydrolase family protein [Glaciimonas immobilis]KAF3997557.1 SGNH/GDSL hydrolase family protein [Glaciimonas immobilis]MBB5200756.1 lysophospholipase L1-like esterase [Glaciimonas immobilis]